MPKYTKPTTQIDQPYYSGDKTSNKTSNNSSNGLSMFQKIKGFFNKQQLKEEPKIPSATTTATTNPPSKAQLYDKSQQFQPLQYLKPNGQSQFHSQNNVSVAAIDLSINSNVSFTSKNPNDTLSQFFSKKGDEPLNDIEIEGVLSLIKKSQSRQPSRNTSMSFADMNNSTILRKSSNNLKVPVKIKTPTFISKSRNVTRNVSRNTSMNQSINNSMNMTTSFLNNSQVQKRRIVSYTNLQSPYKSKSSLSAFLEKKRQKENKEKDKLVYNGGTIDLSNMDKTPTPTLETQINEKSNIKKGNDVKEPTKLSKTATKLLDILDTDIITVDDDSITEIASTSNGKSDIMKPIFEEKEKEKVQEKPTLKETKIETFEKKQPPMFSFEKKSDVKPVSEIKEPSKPSFEIKEQTKPLFGKLDVEKPTFNNEKIEKPSVEKNETVSLFGNNKGNNSFFGNKEDSKLLFGNNIHTKPLFENKADTKPLFETKPMFQTKPFEKNESITEEFKPTENISLFAKETPHTKNSSTVFSSKPNNIVPPTTEKPFSFNFSASEKTKPIIPTNNKLEISNSSSQIPTKSNDIEHIDSFIFPEVESPKKQIINEEPNDQNDQNDFKFPEVPPASPSKLSKISKIDSELYSNAFTF